MTYHRVAPMLVLSVLACCFALHADQVQYTYTAEWNSSWFTPYQDCSGNYDSTCPAMTFAFPQSDPSLGPLDAVTWTLTDSQMDYFELSAHAGSLDDTAAYSRTETMSVMGTDVTATQDYQAGPDLDFCHCFDIGAVLFGGAGTAADSSPFVGTGWYYAEGIPGVSVAMEPNPNFNVFVFDMADDAVLTVTYTVTQPEAARLLFGRKLVASEVPEPYYWHLIALAIGLVWIGRRQ